MSDQTLGAIAVEIGADDRPLDAVLSGAIPKAVAAGAKAGAGFSSSFGQKISGGAGSPVAGDIATAGKSAGAGFAGAFIGQATSDLATLGLAIQGAKEALRIGTEVSGVGIAAQYEKAQLALTNLTGSARDAKMLVGQMANLDALGFAADGIERVDKSLLAVGVSAQRAKTDVAAMADAVAAAGGGAADLNLVGEALTKIKSRPTAELRELMELSRIGINLDKVYSAGTGRPVQPGMGARMLEAMPGQRAYDTIVKGLAATYGGSAQTMADSSAGGIGDQLAKQAALAMKPTGDALLPALEAVGKAALWVTNEFAAFNTVTGGSAGMIGTLAIGTVVVRKLAGDVSNAWTSVVRLTTALEGMAVAANTTAAAAVTAAVAEEAQASVNRTDAILSAAGYGVQEKSASKLPGLISMLGFAIPMAISAGMNGLADKINNDPRATERQKASGGILQSVATGAGIVGAAGAAVGSSIPLLGTAIGAVIGTAIGAIGGLAVGEIKAAHEHDSALKKNTDALNTTASSLNKLSFSSIGGGARMNSSLRNIESEWQIMRMRGMG